jgi:peptidyl-prolyl cis-trans isomerase SurA
MEKIVMLLRTMSILALIFSFVFISCSPKHSDILLSKFGDREIKMGEFEKVYAKNAGSYEQAKKDSLSKLSSFLDLYTYFQMKLRDAEVRGYQKDPNLNSELADYKKKVGITYILEKQLVEPNVKKYYDRRKYEFRVSHIWLKADTSHNAPVRMNEQEIQKFANELLNKIKNGESFDSLCAKYSFDNYNRNTGGDIYYITAGMLTPEFDDAVYSTAPGTIYPNVLHTRWGYHIIKVTDKRERIPAIRVSHIMVGFAGEGGKPDTLAAKQKIDSAYAELLSGKDFAEVAKKYSTDNGTKNNGGDLDFIERRRLPMEFDKPAFDLKLGEFSKVVKTSYGFHIIKQTERKPYPTLEEDKENLKNIYKQVSYTADHDAFLDSLKTKFNFKLNDETFKKVVTDNDSARFTADFVSGKFGKTVKDLTLYTINNKNFSVDTVFSSVQNSIEFSNKLIDSVLLKSVVKNTSGEFALSEEALVYDKVNPEFAALMEDYKNGIYIFKLQDEEVWGKIALDSAKLVNFYNGTKPNYVMPDRVSFDEIFTNNDSVKTVIADLLKKGENFDSVAVKYSDKKSENGAVYNWPLTDQEASDLTKAAAKLAKAGEISEPFANNGGYSFLKLVSKEKSRLKTYEEAKAEVSGAFQEAEGKRLDAEYLNQLKNIYKPEFFYDKLKEAFQQ